MWKKNLKKQKCFNPNNVNTQRDLVQKQQEVRSILQEKGAIIRACIVSVHDVDVPTAYFLHLGKKGAPNSIMHELCGPEGTVTSHPVEIDTSC